MNRPSEVNQEFIDSIPCSSVKDALADVPSIEEVKAAVSKLNCGKTPGIDGLQAEIFKCAGPSSLKRLADLLQMVWNNECVPQDFGDALIVVLYKGKGRKDDC